MTKKVSIIESPTDWIVKPIVADVTRCIVDYAFTIELMDANGKIFMHINLGTDFTIVQDNVRYEVQIDKPVSMGKALILFKTRLLNVQVSKNGNLDLQFSENISLQSKPDEMYEAWGIIVDDEVRFVCMPEGDIAFWNLQ